MKTLYFYFVIIWVIFSYPFILQGKVPAPLDFLVNFYAPWDKYYDTPVKNPAISDVVNQIIPWKTYTAWSWRRGQVPIWNPYNLAGAPHLANWQSAVFYPTNLLFLVFPFTTAWSWNILLAPLLAGLFLIMYLQKIGVSKTAALIGATTFAYGGFMTAWMEWGTLTHALLWLPLALFMIESYRQAKQRKYIALSGIALAMSLLAGHLQVSLYVLALSAMYGFFRLREHFSFLRRLMVALFLLIWPWVLVSIQLIPAVYLYGTSVRFSSSTPGWVKAFQIPISGLATYIAPDFFGNPVTRNSWSNFSYVEMMGYAGILPLILAVLAITLKAIDLTKFFGLVIAVSLALSLETPLADIPVWLRLPILSSSSPARVLGVAGFSLAVLAAVGWDKLTEMVSKKIDWKVLIAIGGLTSAIGALWIWTFLSRNPNATVASRNLIFPTMMAALAFGTGFGLIILSRKRILQKSFTSFLFPFSFFLLTSADLWRFHHKFTPFNSPRLFYPRVPVIDFLSLDPQRTFGLFDANLNLPYLIPSIDGYDPLILHNYAELIAQKAGQPLIDPIRVTGPDIPKSGNGMMQILNDLGVKYVVQPRIHGAEPWELRLWEYPGQFEKIFEDDQYQVFSSLKAQDPSEPNRFQSSQQRRLFVIGLVMSAVAFLGTLTAVAFDRRAK